MSCLDNFAAVFRGKRVFITGHTGFKGSWLSLWLDRLGAQVWGYSLKPETKPNNFNLADIKGHISNHIEADVCNYTNIALKIREASPDFIFHLAAQPLVRRSYKQPFQTITTNVMGTVNLLEAVRELNRNCVVLIVTTDKCYEDIHPGLSYVETDRLGGFDPYSASKAAAELVTASYNSSFFNESCHLSNKRAARVRVATVRAGNVIGGGDWSEDRLIPDAWRAWTSEKTLSVRQPDAIRPWQHVLDCLSGYLAFAAKLYKNELCDCHKLNFGPDGPGLKVCDVLNLLKDEWKELKWQSTGDPENLHETTTLTLDCTLARKVLGWRPRWSTHEAVHRTAWWYNAVNCKMMTAYDACIKDIEDYGN
ncbi:MAG: CDP-glucose 4,6-dehydratase [Candidatus Wallbacteria bacterium HGW-Wallbacteria-1]|jgi:CDP-glucose 4,6-dehydratase|uniref:CDP-glucose 4,6-dehydratase n=1 Tax=Candidatus Wallbacteria bacterium HGW-Wallbacteria-1 TaxID=2013854 RepID=A0A2N1PN23_9BACT|nr:MAG: CDP-glucose 4,6-dehydratase [Candidatus Wallbacteria bacterium HGW-Wallbacteria-1]